VKYKKFIEDKTQLSGEFGIDNGTTGAIGIIHEDRLARMTKDFIRVHGPAMMQEAERRAERPDET